MANFRFCYIDVLKFQVWPVKKKRLYLPKHKSRENGLGGDGGGKNLYQLKKKKKKFNYLWFIRHKPKTWIEKKKESKRIKEGTRQILTRRNRVATLISY